ncbi:MAG: FecR domain-containing protein [Candidatus Pseudobacter hemicellulosilyticus]|uniref:FecR domain-containing protein n=1 Tax=Candidatus Pseudobacter hemicellulosilyticus TaxID=3121375 RepID=A0AAJ5WNP6_9BACT|nr:MAG: FecR domain-containing protein [Pseudobacter sp.]
MNEERITYLLNRFEKKQLTEEEADELLHLLNSGQGNEVAAVFRELLFRHAAVSTSLVPMEALSSSLQTIFSLDSKAPIAPAGKNGNNIRRIRSLRRWGWAAASIFLVTATVTFLVVSSDRPGITPGKSIVHAHDVAPGKDGAILTLSDGTEVVLDNLGNGVVASQNGTRVVFQNGQLSYAPAGRAQETIVYNTMRTPKGRQFTLTLPDGTKVWLNAASSLRYPTAFAERERRVEINGEAYFEVSKDTKKPFFVQINDQAEVKVLGTSFNVSAYKDELSISTTLIEGSVRVALNDAAGHSDPPAGQLSRSGKDQNNAIVLKPGQQARIVNLKGRPAGAATTPVNEPSGIKVLNNADMGKVMAWKNGIFDFNGVMLDEAMRQLERWYDIEVAYEKGVPAIRFAGKLSRDVSLAGLLKGLEESKVRFRMEEGRRLVVMP